MADALLLQFCRRCVRLYGDEIATPNMHLHAHIRECIEAMVQRPYFGCLLLNEQPQPRGPDHATFHPRKNLFSLQPSGEFQETFSTIYPLSHESDVQSSGAETVSTTHWTQIT